MKIQSLHVTYKIIMFTRKVCNSYQNLYDPKCITHKGRRRKSGIQAARPVQPPRATNALICLKSSGTVPSMSVMPYCRATSAVLMILPLRSMTLASAARCAHTMPENSMLSPLANTLDMGLVSSILSVMYSVLTGPGHSEIIATPDLRSSKAQSAAMRSHPALPTPYATLNRYLRPPLEDTLMMRPLFLGTIIL